eukprot:COSAG04_NODE_156_length_22317_cov_10.513954_16_plen_38_part_00
MQLSPRLKVHGNEELRPQAMRAALALPFPPLSAPTFA